MCWQTILMKYHALFLRKSGSISQNLSSAAVVIGALRVKWDQGYNIIGEVRHNWFRYFGYTLFLNPFYTREP